jgi:peptide/nickel transport system permease protein
VQGFTVVIAVFFVVLNLLVDISYAFLDPRIRLD